eukprot:3100775-Rhodomonas_salina.1
MYGTEIAYAATRIGRSSRSLWYSGARSYAKPGTDIAVCCYQPVVSVLDAGGRYPISLRACYAMSGTDLAYGSMRATRCPTLT